MPAVIQVKRGTASSWTSANTVLAAGEIGFETDTKKMKVGDGSTAWTSLGYTATDGDISSVVAGTGLSGGGTSGAVTLNLSTPVATTNGGTGLSSFTTGDLVYASGTNTLANRAIGSTGQVLTVSGGVPTWAAPAGGGKILQVVHGSTSTRVSNSTNVQADTTLTATITPSATSSRILILVSHNSNGKSNGAGGNNNAVILKLYRGSTEIGRTGGVNFISPGATPAIESVLSSASFNVVDSPNTTSATTYKTMFHAANNGPAVVVQESFGGQWDSTSYITLLEVGA